MKWVRFWNCNTRWNEQKDMDGQEDRRLEYWNLFFKAKQDIFRATIGQASQVIQARQFGMNVRATQCVLSSLSHKTISPSFRRRSPKRRSPISFPCHTISFMRPHRTISFMRLRRSKPSRDQYSHGNCARYWGTGRGSIKLRQTPC